MAIFGLVYDGTICQLDGATFPVATGLAWTSDISAVSPAPQVGWTATETAGAWTFAAPAAPPAPTLAQQAAAAMSEGLTVTLSGTMTLAATVFPTDRVTQTKLADVATTINTTGGFPGGGASYPMKDAAGNWHAFTLAIYKTVAAAIAAYASALDLIIDGNPLSMTALPADAVALTV